MGAWRSGNRISTASGVPGSISSSVTRQTPLPPMSLVKAREALPLLRTLKVVDRRVLIRMNSRRSGLVMVWVPRFPAQNQDAD